MYIGILNRWFKPTIGALKISNITQQHLYIVKGSMMDAGLVPMTISSQMAAYYSVMRMGIEFGYIDSYPSVVIKVDRSKQRLFVSPKMLRDIVKTIRVGRPEHHWLTAYVMTQYYLVARAGEVMALTWADIDLEEMTIVINKHVYKGKVLEGTKNKITNNAFPVHPELLPFLQEQYLRTGKSKYVFPATAYYKSTHEDATSSTPMYSCSQILKLLDVVGKTLAIPYKLTTHAFRRGAADYMLRSGMTIHQVAYAMRTSTENLIRSYSVVNESAFVEKYLNEFSTRNVQNYDESAKVVPITKVIDNSELKEN
jgi:integrase